MQAAVGCDGRRGTCVGMSALRRDTLGYISLEVSLTFKDDRIRLCRAAYVELVKFCASIDSSMIELALFKLAPLKGLNF